MSLLIDGHNLIGVLPDIDLADQDDEAQLIRRLQAYHGYSAKDLVVFFDSGQPAGSGPAALRPGPGLQVYYASRSQTADDLIVAYVQKQKQPGQHAVVTNDRELAARAKSAGASIISATRFARELSRGGRRRGQTDRAPPVEAGPSPHDPAFADLYADFLSAEKDEKRFGSNQARSFEWWQESLYGDDTGLAENAVHWLRRFGARKRAVPLVIDALTHGHARVRAAAALALGEMGAASGRSALMECLAGDGSAMVREAAAQALGRLGGDDALNALRTAVKDPKRKVRKTAQEMVARLEGKR